MHIASDHSSKPNAAIIAHSYIAYYSGILCQIAVSAKLWFYAPDGKYQCHIDQNLRISRIAEY
jgi:hypothetical protein